MTLKQILPQLIAVGILILPPLIRAFMSGKAAQQKKGTPRQPGRASIPTPEQRRAAQAWHERQEALRQQRQAQVDARRARVQARMSGGSAQQSTSSVAPVSQADLEQRRREVIAQLTQRAGQQPPQTAPSRMSQSPAASAAQRTARSMQAARRPGPVAPVDFDRPPPVTAQVKPQPAEISRKTSEKQRRAGERQHRALHDSVRVVEQVGVRRRLKVASIPVNRRSLRAAFVLKELLDPPVAMRPAPVLESDVFDNAFDRQD